MDYTACDDNDNSDCDADELDCFGNFEKTQCILHDNPQHTSSVYPRPEVKMIDFDPTGNNAFTGTVSFTTAGQVTPITSQLLLPGANVNSYIGNRFQLMRVSYNLFISNFVNTSATRFALVWDKQPNGALAAYADVYNISPSVAATNVFSHLNFNNRSRFVVLKTWVLPDPISGANPFFTGSFQINMPVVYSSTSFGIPPTSGCLLLVGASTGTQTLTGRFRLRFVDS